jgi:beta-galactosidase
MSGDEAKFRLNRRRLLLTSAGAATLLFASSAGARTTQTGSGIGLGRNQPFDQGWRFRRGTGTGFEKPNFEDSGWRIVDLPHDWSVEDLAPRPSDANTKTIGPFDSAAEGGLATGFTVGGEGWYRKSFRVSVPPKGRVEILFEGIYMQAEVWVNGRRLGAHANGYTPFAYDLTPYLEFSGNNVVVVHVSNRGKNSRWYSGSGIYRHVWLDVLPEQTRISRWGVKVATRRIESDQAEIELTARIDDLVPGLILVSRLKDEQGRVLNEVTDPASSKIVHAMTISQPHLWSPETPALYTIECELRRGKDILDRSRTEFGVRIVAFNADEGMTLNGVPTKLRGGCIHHDNGLLGAAAFDAAEERKVLLLKTRGFNAVRPSHNLFSAAFLQACDRHGLIVIGETFDVWQEPKLPQDFSVDFGGQWRSELEAIVLSAQNHASIIMWCIGNEIPGRNTPAGIQWQWRLANEVHRLDPTRAVTAAVNGFVGRPVTPSKGTARVGFAGVADQTSVIFLDVVGYNYKLDDYEPDHAQYPRRVLFGTESFPKDLAKIWALTEKSPWLIGDFVWTAMDYLGEAGIGGSTVVAEKAAASPLASMSSWPWINAFCGDIDLIGQQKAQSFARDVVWGISPMELLVRRPVPVGSAEVVRIWGWHDEQRSWTWPGSEGQKLAVCVYTVGDRVELHLNGRKLDVEFTAAENLPLFEFSVGYEPGELEAVAFRKGTEIARQRLRTVGPAAAIRVTPEHPNARFTRADVSFLSVEIIDGDGRLVPDAAQDIDIAVSGPATLLGFGSANPLAAGSFQSFKTQSWNGRALVVLRGTGRTGSVNVEVRAEGLRKGNATVRPA